MIKTPTVLDRDEEEDIGFLHTVLTQVGLPRDRQEARTFTRTNGGASMLLEAGNWYDGLNWQPMPLPFGTRPRLILYHACSEAVRTRKPTIAVESSMSAFLRRLGINTGGKNMGRFKEQMKALAVCHLTLALKTADKGIVTIKNADPVERFAAWFHHDEEGQGVLWPGELTLSQRFFDTLLEYAVPLSQTAIAQLQNSALALDVYAWLAHRLCRINAASGVSISWPALKSQFGQEYKSEKDFKREMTKSLQRALEVYPAAKVEKVRGGIKLLPSAPPIARKTHVVALPQTEVKPRIQEAPRRKFISPETLDKVREVAPGWCKYSLENQYKEWSNKQAEQPRDIDAAFIGWVKRFTKGKRP
jgi:Plasmid encoded RepA protein